MSDEWLDICVRFLASKGVEDCVLEAYQCSADVWTIGIGTTVYPDGTPVKEGDTCTESEAYAYCEHYLLKRCDKVRGLINNDDFRNGAKFAAIMSLMYNIGFSAFADSTALKRINTGFDDEAIIEAWGWWNKAGGKKLQGLVNRRNKEIDLAFG